MKIILQLTYKRAAWWVGDESSEEQLSTCWSAREAPPSPSYTAQCPDLIWPSGGSALLHGWALCFDCSFRRQSRLLPPVLSSALRVRTDKNHWVLRQYGKKPDDISFEVVDCELSEAWVAFPISCLKTIPQVICPDLSWSHKISRQGLDRPSSSPFPYKSSTTLPSYRTSLARVSIFIWCLNTVKSFKRLLGSPWSFPVYHRLNKCCLFTKYKK